MIEHSIGIFAIGTLLATDDLVAAEIESSGLIVKGRQLGWVTAEGSLEDAYRMLLRSRVGDRVVWLIKRGEGASIDQFRQLLAEVAWNELLYPGTSIRVDVTGQVAWLKDTRFAGQLIMDAIRDQAALLRRPRPEYDSVEPGVRIAVRFGRGQVDVGVNLNKTPLNQRGYRTEGGEAPLRETLAQVMLARLKIGQGATPFIIDPCCGSGTILIEAAMLLNRLASQRFRLANQLSRWTGLETFSWTALVTSERLLECESKVRFIGFDNDSSAVERARNNIERACLSDQIEIREGCIEDLNPSVLDGLDMANGWLLANPPYGTRLNKNQDLPSLYRALGEQGKLFIGANLGLVTSEAYLMQAVGLRADKKWELQAGGLRLNIARFALGTSQEGGSFEVEPRLPPDEVMPLLNRLSKNLKARTKLFKQNEIDCYRIYDAELPEFNVAIDKFGDYLHIQEYRPPKTVDEKRAAHRRQLIRQWVPKHLEISIKKAIYKERFRQSGSLQYEKHTEALCIDAHENGLIFEINLTTYTDVGLFLDHRVFRKWLMESCKGKRVLNLFCYTGSLSVAAAKGSARSVTSIDMSKNYLTWAHRNFEKNSLNPKNYNFIRDNVLEWIRESPRPEYDVVILDPPTFSNTKSTEETLDIRRDHCSLIDESSAWLAPYGVLYFSNNARGFQLDPHLHERYEIIDLTKKSIDADFNRRPPHKLFKLSLR